MILQMHNKKASHAGGFQFVKNLMQKRIEIVVGGVYGDHVEIFSKKILFSRRKNLHLADFTTGIQRIQVKSGEGGCGGGMRSMGQVVNESPVDFQSLP